MAPSSKASAINGYENMYALNPKNAVRRTETKKLSTAKDTGISYFSN